MVPVTEKLVTDSTGQLEKLLINMDVLGLVLYVMWYENGLILLGEGFIITNRQVESYMASLRQFINYNLYALNVSLLVFLLPFVEYCFGIMIQFLCFLPLLNRKSTNQIIWRKIVLFIILHLC